MCGVAGTYGEPRFSVSDALDRIAHRGPDGRGIVEAGDAVHGHVRLAIQDPLPRSDQPFRYGDVTLAYVGELWDVDVLRSRLDAEGYAFETTGDTEVLAAALDRWGVGALLRLDGMFAFSWSDSTGTYLARDRFGKVPLYWIPPDNSLLGSGVAWASERKAFGDLAPLAEAVPPGAIVRVSDGATVERYYDLPEAPEGAEASPERVRDLLARGVSRRLVSDVPLCCLISGGLDSALILALVRKRVPGVVAYHAYRDPASPDLAAARRLCDEWDVDLREVRVADPTEGDVRAAVRAVEVPMKAQVEIALLCLPLARRIREDGFRVVLSGEAADEIFGGYGNLARRATRDDEWRRARRASVAKMSRGNFCRVNKVFMAHGVEGRLPFMERELVELALNLGIKECPPGKGLLKEAARGIVPDWVIKRPKDTFQRAGGMISACAGLFDSPVVAYNQMARETFGMIPRE